MRKYLDADMLKFMAKHMAKNITIRTYENGNSKDEKRPATKEEQKIIYNVAYGALHTLNYGEQMRSSKEMTQAVIDNAEITLDLFIPNCNGYDTMYCPLQKIVRDWEGDIYD